MSLDFSGLGDLAKQSPTKQATSWQPPTIDDLGYGTALCFDQSLTATGCLLLSRVYPGGLVVRSASQWKDPYEGKEVSTSLKRGVAVFDQARAVIRATTDVYRPDAFVHESPPNPSAVKGMGISSLLAAQALHCAADAEGVEFEMIGSQPAKKFICGNANAKKVEAHAALKAHVLPWVVNSQQVTNEATRDALMVGLLWLARRK